MSPDPKTKAAQPTEEEMAWVRGFLRAAFVYAPDESAEHTVARLPFHLRSYARRCSGEPDP